MITPNTMNAGTVAAKDTATTIAEKMCVPVFTLKSMFFAIFARAKADGGTKTTTHAVVIAMHNQLSDKNVLIELKATIAMLEKDYRVMQKRFGTGGAHLHRKIKAIKRAVELVSTELTSKRTEGDENDHSTNL